MYLLKLSACVKSVCACACVLYTRWNASPCAAINPFNYSVLAATEAFIRAWNIAIVAEAEEEEAGLDEKSYSCR